MESYQPRCQQCYIIQMVCRGAGGSGGATQPMMASVGGKYVVSVHAIKNSHIYIGKWRIITSVMLTSTQILDRRYSNMYMLGT